MATYHIGFGKRGKTFVIQATRSVDCLSCEIYDYMGERIVSKNELRRNRYDVLKDAKRMNPSVYGPCLYAVVE